MFPFAYPSPVIAAGGVALYRDTDLQSASLTTYTFTGKAIGPAAGDRYVFVGTFQGFATKTVSSMTIGGISASLVVSKSAASGTAELWMANVPTGTTATIVVTWSGGVDIACGIGVWSATGLSSTTPVDTDTGVISSGTPLVLTSTAGGFALSCGVHPQTSDLFYSGVTEDYDTNAWNPGGGNIGHWAGGSGVTSGSSINVNMTDTNANSATPWLVATFF